MKKLLLIFLVVLHLQAQTITSTPPSYGMTALNTGTGDRMFLQLDPVGKLYVSSGYTGQATTVAGYVPPVALVLLGPSGFVYANADQYGNLYVNFAGGGSNATQLQGVPISAATPTTGQLLAYNGTSWAPATGGGAGSVTSIATSSPISGGTITSTGTISCPTCAVTGSTLAQFASTTSAQLATVISNETGSGALVFAGAPALTGTVTIGSSGSSGALSFGNSTSGTITLQTVTGTLGSSVASLPANTGTIAELNLAQTFSAVVTISAANGLILSNMTGQQCIEEVSGVMTVSGSNCGSAATENPASSTTPTFSANTRYSTITVTANITTFTLGTPTNTSQDKTLTFCENGTGGFSVAAPTNVHGFMNINSSAVASKCNSQHFNWDTTQSAWIADSPGVINE